MQQRREPRLPVLSRCHVHPSERWLQVAEGIDLFQNPGRLKLKTVFKIVEVKDGKLEIDFSTVVRAPIINAIKIEASP